MDSTPLSGWVSYTSTGAGDITNVKRFRSFFLLSLASCSAPRHVSSADVVETSSSGDVQMPSSTQTRAASATAPTTNACPTNMALIDGDYCPIAEEVCIDPVGGENDRCKEFAYPTRCLAKRVHKRFCIDTYEYPNAQGSKPTSWLSWSDMKAACEGLGKRLCTKSEWTFSCEGPNMQPYPYGDGYHRDKSACNFDNSPIDVWADTKTKRALDNLLMPSGMMPRCVSPFGVHDMVGNIDEWVVNESGRPYSSGLVGGHVFGVRNACRPMTDAHNESFSWYETGGRCCVTR